MKIVQNALFFLVLLLLPDKIWGQLSFGAHNNVGVGGFGGQKSYLVTADLNGDGVSDLIGSNETNQLRVILLNEDGLFLSSTPLPGPNNMYAVVAADFDLDGDVDIAAIDGVAYALQLFKNNGNGTFGGATNFNIPNTPPINANGARELISYDYNQDGFLDLISFVRRADGVYALAMFENNTLGGFIPSRSPISGLLATYNNKHKMAFGVMDNISGKVDIFLVMNGQDLYKISDVTSSPTGVLFYAGTGGDTFTDVKVGDFNLDGNTDITFASKGNAGFNNYLKVSQGNGIGGILDYYQLNFVADTDLENITVQDIDNDTDLDILVSKQGNLGGDPNRKVLIFENLIIDTFPFTDFNLAAPVVIPTNNQPAQIAIADFNVDGKLDFAVPIIGGDDIDRFLNTSPVADAPIVPDASINVNGAGFINTSLLLSKTTNFTIEGYFIADPAFTTHRQYLFYNGFTGLNGFGLYIDDTGSGELFIEGVDNVGNPFDFSTGMNVTSSTEWQHFAVVVDKSNNWHFYLNGTPRFNISLIGIMQPTNTTLIGARNLTVPPANLGIDTGNLQEYRFWNVALDTKTIREWMHVQLDNTHTFYFTLNSYFPLNENAGSIVRDLAYTLNPISLYKTGTIINPAGWDNTDSAPIGDNGSGEVENATADINSRIKTGIEIDFQTPSGGSLAISRMFEEKEPTFYPNDPSLIYSKVFWTFRQYGGSATFPDLDELIIDIKDDQFISGLYPILNTPSDPNSAANSFKLFMRPVGSTNQADWVQVGIGSGFGSLRARRPGSTVSEFGRELVVGVDPNTLPVRLISFEGKKIDASTNILDWITSFEFDNVGFEVEKSYDAKNFFKIGTLAGQEKTTEKTKYQYEDKYGLESAYYRLRQKDKSGKVSYSKVIYVSSWDINGSTLKVYPNPVSTEMYLNVKVSEDEELVLSIQSVYGEQVLLLQGTKSSIEQQLNKKIQNFSKGLYLLKLSSPYKTYSTKFIKN
ncbi:MAG: FG-GAP-like repeat-containing protein [Raineya sp.]|jgi:hypothetical protein|nr:FG-GAP-like repeat-containing protein [Raineya sp.]